MPPWPVPCQYRTSHSECVGRYLSQAVEGCLRTLAFPRLHTLSQYRTSHSAGRAQWACTTSASLSLVAPDATSVPDIA
eukprot:1217704-Rhodomonas_salina.1